MLSKLIPKTKSKSSLNGYNLFFVDETDSILSCLNPSGPYEPLHLNSIIYPELSTLTVDNCSYDSIKQAQSAGKALFKKDKELEFEALTTVSAETLPLLSVFLNREKLLCNESHALQHSVISKWINSCLEKIKILLQFRNENGARRAGMLLLELTDALSDHISESEIRFKVALSSTSIGTLDKFNLPHTWRALSTDCFFPTVDFLQKLRNKDNIVKFSTNTQGLVEVTDSLTEICWLAAKLFKMNILSTSIFEHVFRNLHFVAPHMADRIELVKSQVLSIVTGDLNKSLRSLVLLFARQSIHNLLPAIRFFRSYVMEKRFEDKKEIKSSHGRKNSIGSLETGVWPLGAGQLAGLDDPTNELTEVF